MNRVLLYLLIISSACFYIACSDNSVSESLSEAETSPKIVFKWVTQKSSGLYIVDTETFRIYGLAHGSSPCWSNDGSKILFSRIENNISNIMTINPDATEIASLVSSGDEFTFLDNPVWSPDDSKIALTVTREGAASIRIIDSDGANSVDIETGFNFNTNFVWSPDGSKIAFFCGETGVNDNNIYACNVDGSGLVRLTDSPGDFSIPSWKPDGSGILYSSGDKIYKVNINGSEVVYLADGLFPVFSPDGSRIAYVFGNTEERALYTMKPDGTEQVRLSFVDEVAYLPAWSPDGSRIAFIGQRLNVTGEILSSTILQVDIQDGSATYLVPVPGAVLSYSWSPEMQW
ncbi:TolB family protein [candidate division KSB1 bacterium]